MAQAFDVVVVGGGSAGAVIAARLSEDPTCRVVLVEAGGTPPPEELMPAACSALQLNPETDWMYTADAGNAGLGLAEGRMMVPRGKMLGGSSGINYMAYVRGHPGDFDSWAANGATGWSYEEVLAYFKKSEGLAPSGDITVDRDAHAALTRIAQTSPDAASARGLKDLDVQILRRIEEGMTNEEIALALFRSAKTIRNRNRDIFRNLGVANRTAAVTEARKAGILGA